MRFLRKSLVGLLLLGLAVGLLAYAAQMVGSALQDRASQGKRDKQKRERVFTVNVVTAEAQSIAPVMRAFGEVQSRRTLDLRMPTGGHVVALSKNFVEGGQVISGDLLVQLSTSDAQSDLLRTEADVKDALDEVSEAKRALSLMQNELKAAQDQEILRARALARQIDLKERGVGTAAAVENAELAASAATQALLSKHSTLDQVKSRGAQAETRLARAKLALDDAKRRLEDTSLVAEFDGVLGGVTLVKGGLVGANERLGQLIDPSALEVSFRISTDQYTRLLSEEGALIKSPVTVSIEGLGENLKTNAELVRDSGAVADGQSGRVLFAAMKGTRGFMPGDFVTLEVTEPVQKYVVKLPASALNSNSEILLINDEERLEAMRVSLVRRQGNDILVRARGLSGRAVVAEQTPVLGNGIKVKPVRTGPGGPKVEEPEMVELSDERRAKLMAFIEGNGYIPADAKKRILKQLKKEKVPAKVVERIESRIGG